MRCLKNEFGIAEIEEALEFPLREGARRLGCSPTCLKQRCRRLGVTRWPARVLGALRKRQARLRHLHGPAAAELAEGWFRKVRSSFFAGNPPAHTLLAWWKRQEVAARFGRVCTRVPVWNGRLGRKVAGMAAPEAENLNEYLAAHPHCEVYRQELHGQGGKAVTETARVAHGAADAPTNGAVEVPPRAIFSCGSLPPSSEVFEQTEATWDTSLLLDLQQVPPSPTVHNGAFAYQLV
jgi:hypothetical protein